MWDGHALLGALTAAADVLGSNKERVNALNVFPTPDGDTGTNMTLSLRAAVDEATRLDSAARDRVGTVALKVSYGALMGACGNSGNILSQILRGFAQAIADLDTIDGRDVARALAGAYGMAYKAVLQPVEGTMLTVIRVAAERAGAVAARTPALTAVLTAAVAGAREALEGTPKLLDILRQAGVVDAGGQGLVYILDGLERYGRGEPVMVEPASNGALGAEMAFLDRVAERHGEDAFGYCCNFLIVGEGIDFERVRGDLAAMGESAVIVGDSRIVKVHIHALNPGRLLDYAVHCGELEQIKIDNMSAQIRTLTEQRAASRIEAAERPSPSARVEAPLGGQAVLAVAAGEGLANALRSMGATGIVPGGHAMNPTIEELLAAVEAAPVAEVILLPNNPNITLAADQVPALSKKTVRVVPSRSVPEGLAALSVFNADNALDANAAKMRAALAAVRTVEITSAEQDASVAGIRVVKGQVIGWLDERLVASGADDIAVATDSLARADLDAAELVTIFTGAGATPACAAALREAILVMNAALDVQVYEGGQPHERYLISVE